ncbi:hypothetical protein FVE85_1774 [Porphyridium purpureum]|uniref:Uncharacterized protein n=1 Tax=Porphyridium purpureum TaxID=35688 RepID=A0A5J4YVT1_PORPP|nr:hypothetical protein FVE85_1774 [Porphyridium purpureum]|eukprot:POR5688..scf209_3
MATLKTFAAIFRGEKLPPEVYPIMAATSVAFGLAFYFGLEKLFRDPSVQPNKHLRQKPFCEQYKAYGDHGHLAAVSQTKRFSTRMFESPFRGENVVAKYNTHDALDRETARLAPYRSV